MYQINFFATDRVIPAAKNEKELDNPNPLKRGGAQLVHRTPRLSFFSGEDLQMVRAKRHMNNGYLM